MTLEKQRTSTNGRHPGLPERLVAPVSAPVSFTGDRPSPTSNSVRSELSSHDALAELLRTYDPVDLVDLDSVALLNRMDTKYVLTHERLLAAFATLSRHYRALDIDGRRLNRYHTLYFDSSGMALYRLHHAGKQPRHKLRSREYVESGLYFFEIKEKTNKGLTVKHRLPTRRLTARITPDIEEYLSSRSPRAESDVSPVLINDFTRATLVNREEAGVGERITVDIDLKFAGNGRQVPLPGTAIVEVKQAGVNWSSPAMKTLRAAGVFPTSVSKYCLGVSLLYEYVKHNSFKPTLVLIKKLMREAGNV